MIKITPETLQQKQYKITNQITKVSKQRMGELRG